MFEAKIYTVCSLFSRAYKRNESDLRNDYRKAIYRRNEHA